MKYLLILLAFLLFGCQQNSNIEKQIKLQEDLIDIKHELLLSDLNVKYTVNPAKYTGLFMYVQELGNGFNAVQKELLVSDGLNDKSKEIVFNYYKIVENSLMPGYLEDEFKKCKSCINDILNGKSMSMQERKMLMIYLKTFHTTFAEKVIEDETSGDFKFNKIQPIVLADKQKLKLGETYEARIMLVAVDTTRQPIYKVKNASVEFGSRGEGVVRFKTKKRGVQKWGGTVIWPTEKGMTIELDFEQTYIVE